MIKILDKKKIKYYSCIKELNVDNNKPYFLQTKEHANENDNSSVIYTELDGYKFMFMGDAGIEKDILDKYNLLNFDVLKIGHLNKEVLDNLENSKIYRTVENGNIMFKIKNNRLKTETCLP